MQFTNVCRLLCIIRFNFIFLNFWSNNFKKVLKTASGNYLAGCAPRFATSTKSLYFCNTNYCNDASMVSTPSKFNLCLFYSQKTNFFDQDYVASCYYATGYTDVKSTAPCPSNTECCYVNDNIFSNHITTKINQFFYI